MDTLGDLTGREQVGHQIAKDYLTVIVPCHWELCLLVDVTPRGCRITISQPCCIR